MRRSLLGNFHKVWIDNLNGDKFKTGKLVPRGLPGEGTADQSAFTTEMDPRGIQPGTAIVTWLKRRLAPNGPDRAEVLYRDLWGLARWKRQALLASLPAGDAPADSAVPSYLPIRPSHENRWRLSPHSQEVGYESWPGMDELFPVMFQGVNHNRGVDHTVIDTDRDRLFERMRTYIDSVDFQTAIERVPTMAGDYAGYHPETVWNQLHRLGFERNKIRPFLTFPFDQRWLYYETERRLLNRSRPELAANLGHNEFLVTVPEPRKASETRPLYATVLVNLHVHERGSVLLPRESQPEGILAHRVANIAEPTWRVLREHFGLSGGRRDEDARILVGRLFRAALAILHAPAYQADHKSALSADWAHLPIPKDRGLFERLVQSGEHVARLLDANRDARAVVLAILGEECAVALAPLRRRDGGSVMPEDLRVTVSYWGGARGRWVPREFASDEPSIETWGKRTGDLYIGEEGFFANLPERVWAYELGGYPVLKKWLGYRQANRRDGRPLTTDERRWFRSMVQRIAALLALAPTLDELYSGVADNAFTARDLGIVTVAASPAASAPARGAPG
jgi:hypothetical protein